MLHPKTLILYVSDVAQSAAFYRDLFSVPVVEQSPNFGMLALPSGFLLGLWARHDVSPATSAPASGVELCVTLGDEAATNAAFAEAQARGIPVLQSPCHLDFGYTFVLESPDGHRLRVFNPGE